MKDIYCGAASKISTTGKNLIIIGRDSTRYIIPVFSVDSIIAEINAVCRLVTFNFNPEIWVDCDCKSISFDVGTKKNIDTIINEFHKLGRSVPILYDNDTEPLTIIY